MSKRKTIRSEIFTLLYGNISYSGEVIKVNDTRVLPHKMETLPQINIYILAESADYKNTNPKEYYRDAKLGIEIVQKASINIDNDLIDDITEAIENILFSNPFLITGVSDDIVYEGLQTTLEDSGERVTANTETKWSITYRTPAPIPVESSSLDDFETEHTTYDMNNNENSQIESETNL